MMRALLFAALLAPAAANASYFGVQLGNATLDIDTTGATAVDDSNGTFKGFLGAQLSENLAIEMSLAGFGTYSAYYPFWDEYDEAQISALAGHAVFNPRITDNVRFLAKLGLALWTAEVTMASYAGDYYGNAVGSGISPAFGFGIELDATRNFSLRAEFERYTHVLDDIQIDVTDGWGRYIGTATTDGVDLDVVGLSASFRF